MGRPCNRFGTASSTTAGESASSFLDRPVLLLDPPFLDLLLLLLDLLLLLLDLNLALGALAPLLLERGVPVFPFLLRSRNRRLSKRLEAPGAESEGGRLSLLFRLPAP